MHALSRQIYRTFFTVSLLLTFVFPAAYTQDSPKNKFTKLRGNKYSIEKTGRMNRHLVPECSGIIPSGNADSSCWVHGDNGTPGDIVRIDRSGSVLQRITLVNIPNKDWEDVARDPEGNIYIGDIGNNLNTRRAFSVYVLIPPAEKDKTAHLLGSVLYQYPDQKEFPPEKKKMNYDCEAMFWFNGNLYFVSKSRGNRVARLYRLPRVHDLMNEGVEQPTLADSIHLKKTILPFTGLVTGADISPLSGEGAMLALLTYGRIYLFSGFKEDDFFSGKVQWLRIPFSQTEAICFISARELLVTNERGKMFVVRINP